MSDLTAEYKIKRHILIAILAEEEIQVPCILDDGTDISTETKGDIDDLWQMAGDYESPFGEVELSEWLNEFRCCGEQTTLDCHDSRNYEAAQVAEKLSCGAFVSWTYWTGGGKHGSPEDVEWIEHAYEVDCKEEQRTVTVRTYTEKSA